MSATNTTTESGSVAMDATASEASVNARGSEIGAAIRARAIQRRNEADAEIDELDAMGQRDSTTRWATLGEWSAFHEILEWLDDLEANAAT